MENEAGFSYKRTKPEKKFWRKYIIYYYSMQSAI
jgi:hypothetical protein